MSYLVPHAPCGACQIPNTLSSDFSLHVTPSQSQLATFRSRKVRSHSPLHARGNDSENIDPLRQKGIDASPSAFVSPGTPAILVRRTTPFDGLTHELGADVSPEGPLDFGASRSHLDAPVAITPVTPSPPRKRDGRDFLVGLADGTRTPLATLLRSGARSRVGCDDLSEMARGSLTPFTNLSAVREMKPSQQVNEVASPVPESRDIPMVDNEAESLRAALSAAQVDTAAVERENAELVAAVQQLTARLRAAEVARVDAVAAHRSSDEFIAALRDELSAAVAAQRAADDAATVAAQRSAELTAAVDVAQSELHSVQRLLLHEQQQHQAALAQTRSLRVALGSTVTAHTASQATAAHLANELSHAEARVAALLHRAEAAEAKAAAAEDSIAELRRTSDTLVGTTADELAATRRTLAVTQGALREASVGAGRAAVLGAELTRLREISAADAVATARAAAAAAATRQQLEADLSEAQAAFAGLRAAHEGALAAARADAESTAARAEAELRAFAEASAIAAAASHAEAAELSAAVDAAHERASEAEAALVLLAACVPSDVMVNAAREARLSPSLTARIVAVGAERGYTRAGGEFSSAGSCRASQSDPTTASPSGVPAIALPTTAARAQARTRSFSEVTAASLAMERAVMRAAHTHAAAREDATAPTGEGVSSRSPVIERLRAFVPAVPRRARSALLSDHVLSEPAEASLPADGGVATPRRGPLPNESIVISPPSHVSETRGPHSSGAGGEYGIATGLLRSASASISDPITRAPSPVPPSTGRRKGSSPPILLSTLAMRRNSSAPAAIDDAIELARPRLRRAVGVVSSAAVRDVVEVLPAPAHAEPVAAAPIRYHASDRATRLSLSLSHPVALSESAVVAPSSLDKGFDSTRAVAATVPALALGAQVSVAPPVERGAASARGRVIVVSAAPDLRGRRYARRQLSTPHKQPHVSASGPHGALAFDAAALHHERAFERRTDEYFYYPVHPSAGVAADNIRANRAHLEPMSQHGSGSLSTQFAVTSSVPRIAGVAPVTHHAVVASRWAAAAVALDAGGLCSSEAQHGGVPPLLAAAHVGHVPLANHQYVFRPQSAPASRTEDPPPPACKPVRAGAAGSANGDTIVTRQAAPSSSNAQNAAVAALAPATWAGGWAHIALASSTTGARARSRLPRGTSTVLRA